MKSVLDHRANGYGMGEAAQRPFLWFLIFREKKGVHRRERLWECGNLALSARFPRHGGKRGKPVFGFPRFPRAHHFHCFRYLNFGNDDVCHCRSNLALAALIRRAHSVSLITSARFSSSGKLNPGFKVTLRKSYGFRTFRCLELALHHSLGKLPEPESTHEFF